MLLHVRSNPFGEGTGCMKSVQPSDFRTVFEKQERGDTTDGIPLCQGHEVVGINLKNLDFVTVTVGTIFNPGSRRRQMTHWRVSNLAITISSCSREVSNSVSVVMGVAVLIIVVPVQSFRK